MIEKCIAVFFCCSYKASGDFLFHGPSFTVLALGPWPLSKKPFQQSPSMIYNPLYVICSSIL